MKEHNHAAGKAVSTKSKRTERGGTDPQACTRTQEQRPTSTTSPLNHYTHLLRTTHKVKHHPTTLKSYPTNIKPLPPLQNFNYLPHITLHNYSPATQSKPLEDHNHTRQPHTAPEGNQTSRNPARTSTPPGPEGTTRRKTHKSTSRKPNEEQIREKGTLHPPNPQSHKHKKAPSFSLH